MVSEAGLKQIEKTENNDQNRQQFVTFKLGQETYGILIRKVKEIIKPKRITQVPNTENYVLGVINLRGQIVPVVNLKNKLKLDGNSSKDSEERIITVDINDALIGIKVDQVNEVVWLENDSIDPPPEMAGGIREEHLQGVGRENENLLVLLDLTSLLFADNEEKLSSDEEIMNENKA